MKLSLLAAVRDEGLYIRQMIESVLSQSHEEWELLFVDDGSSDETVAIIEEFAERDARVRLVEAQDAKGKVSAFNKAFAASSGEVICIHGGDDISREGAFRARLKPFETDPHGTFAMFKLRSFSDDSRFDGMVLPKGEKSSTSGPSLTMSRDLAERVFPIPVTLVAEDIYLSSALDAVATKIVHSPEIVVDYRIHDGNSNPRNKPFHVMTEASHLRHMAYEELLSADHLPLRSDQERLFRARLRVEHFRYEGPTWRILTVGEASWPDRLASLSRAHPALFALRKRFYRALSGLRGA